MNCAILDGSAANGNSLILDDKRNFLEVTITETFFR